MHLSIYLPIAGTSVNVFLLIALGLFVGSLSGLFGVGGGFLLTPLLIAIGIPPTVAAASDSNQIVAATCSGTYAHWKMGHVDIKMGLLLLTGGICGGMLGVEIIKLLRQVGNADFLIKISYVLFLSLIGTFMFQESFRTLHRYRRKRPEKPLREEARFHQFTQKLPLKTAFPRSGTRFSFLLPLILGFLVGILAAIMGLGGGFIMVPILIYILRLPMHMAIGTNLFQEIFLCINVTFMQALINHTVDFVLALILLIGSTLGAQLGAAISNRLKADQLKILLSAIILLVMLNMLRGLLVPPHTLISIKGIHS